MRRRAAGASTGGGRARYSASGVGDRRRGRYTGRLWYTREHGGAQWLAHDGRPDCMCEGTVGGIRCAMLWLRWAFVICAALL